MPIRPYVALRALTLEDAVTIAGWAVDPIFCQAADWSVDLPPSGHVSFQTGLIAAPPTELVRLGAVLDGRLVGYVALQGIGLKRRELGFVIGERTLWGSGLGTAAASAGLCHGFLVMRLSRIWAEALDTNAASLRILERLGMRETGLGAPGTYSGQASHYRQFAITSDEFVTS